MGAGPLIDQTRQEAKEASKKLEKLHNASSEQIQNLKMQLLSNQQVLFEKNTKIKLASDQINDAKKEIEMLKSKNIKSTSII